MSQERPDLSDRVKQVCLVFSRLMGCNVLQLPEGGGNAPESCLYAAHTVCLYRERFNNGALRSLEKTKEDDSQRFMSNIKLKLESEQRRVCVWWK